MSDIIRPFLPEHNPLFETFFEYMDEVSSYVMGYIYAKGIIVTKRGVKTVVIRNKKDIRTLYRIKEILGVKEDISKDGTLRIASNAICNSLQSYGFSVSSHTQKKTGPTTMPFLESNLTRHFVRGYFDACGYCTPEIEGRPDDSQRILTYMPFRNSQFMEDFKLHMVASGGPTGSLHIYSDRSHTLKFYHNMTKALYWYMYADAFIYSIDKKAKMEHGFGLIYKAKKRYWDKKNKKE